MSDFSKIESLFQAAADLPESERDAFLREAVDEYPKEKATEILEQVHRLLGRLEDGQSLNPPPVAFSGPILSAAKAEGPGSMIGPYKLLQVIGEGGFGVVYMAEQLRPIQRKVAIKVIKLGMDTQEVVARFEAERQALALMDHPNIAKVLDGGATESGRPYFVMELVRGISIAEYCDKNSLDTEARLKLFLRTCQAVHHAHQKGVIHRDLKPSNVLVTLHDGEPVPKVIDFGVAKAMHGKLTERTLFTRYEQFIGTPAYMSPEQAEMSALDIDTRSDIYSLGVLLYELLTGTIPFDQSALKQGGLAEFQRMVREEAPVRPSVRLSTRGQASGTPRQRAAIEDLVKKLRGDLDWVVMRALEKDRGRRYPSASEFAEDILRFLRQEPVSAGPPGPSYRLRKFLGRNRRFVLSVALITLALVLGIVATTTAMLRANHNEKQAKANRDRALRSLDFVLSTLSLTDPDVALNPNANIKTLLDYTSSQVEKTFGDDPWAEARVRATIGQAYMNLGESEIAEKHLRRVMKIVEPHSKSESKSPMETPQQLSSGFTRLDYHQAMWALTNVCFNLERGDSFEMSTRARKVGATCLATVSPKLAQDFESLAEAIEQGAWSIDKDALKDIPDQLADVCRQAEQKLEPGDPHWMVLVNGFLAGGYTVWHTTHEALSERMWKESLAIQRRELPADHPDIATTVSLLVSVLNRLGKTEESERLIRDGLERLRGVVEEESLALAIAESMLGETLGLQGRFEEAESLLLNSHNRVVEEIGDPANWRCLESAVRVVQLYDRWGRSDKARAFRDTLAEAMARAVYAPMWISLVSVFDAASSNHDAAIIETGNAIHALCGKITVLSGPGRVHSEEISQKIATMIELMSTRPDPTDSRSVLLARLLLVWARTLDEHHHLEERTLIAESVLAPLRAWSRTLSLDLASALALRILGAIRESSGEATETQEWAREALAALRAAPDIQYWYLASTRARVAKSLGMVGFVKVAEETLIEAHAQIVEQLGKEHPEAQWTENALREIQPVPLRR